MLKARPFVALAVAASVAAHVTLVLGLLFAGAAAIDNPGTVPIAVDLVPQDEVPPGDPATADTPQSLPPSASPSASPSSPAADATPSQTAADASPSAPSQAIADAPQAAAARDPQPDAAIPSYLRDVTPQSADIATRYGVMLGLPQTTIGETGGKADSVAELSQTDIAALRRHLRTCARRPPQIGPNERVRVVLRVPLTTDGRLASAPVLVEASASAKGPLLMQSAIAALTACQPFAMLPADKYREWRVLDLAFTPEDFGA